MGHTGTAARVRPEPQPLGPAVREVVSNPPPAPRWAPRRLRGEAGPVTTDFIRDGHTQCPVRRAHTARCARPTPTLCRPQGSLPPPAAWCSGQVRAGPPLPTPKAHHADRSPRSVGSVLPAARPAGGWERPPPCQQMEKRRPGPRPPAPAAGALGSGVSASTTVSSCQHAAPHTPQDRLWVSPAPPAQQTQTAVPVGTPRRSSEPRGQASRLPGLRPRQAGQRPVRRGGSAGGEGQEEVGAADTTSSPGRT